jgi:hypothetical protein
MNIPKSAFAAALGGLLITACSTADPCPQAAEHFTHPIFSIPAEADANIALAENHLNALITVDAAAIRASVAPNFYANNTWFPEDSSDVEGVIQNWSRNDSTRTDQKISKVYAQSIEVADGHEYPGQWVQYWGTYSATDKASGKPFKAKFILDANVKDGRLIKTYLWFDRLSGFHQLGKTPPEAPVAKQ